MAEAADLTAALVAVAAVRARFSAASDDELLGDLAVVEQMGRVVDGLRVAAAAQVEQRSRPILGSASLAFRSGARDGVELVQQIARIGHGEAGRRVGLGSAIAPRTGLLGEPLPGRLPAVTDAVVAGRIGLESARVIVNTWKPMRLRVDDDRLAGMVESLIEYAQRTDTEAVRDVAGMWSLAIDPDGAEPRERAQRRKRALRIGATLSDGTTRMTMILTPEDLAMFRELLQSRRRGIRLVRTEPGGDDTDDTLAPQWREQDGPDPEQDDPRLRSQQDYDTVIEALAVAGRAEAEGIDGTAVPHETVVTVSAEEVERRAGQGWAPGVLAGLPMPVIERRACTGDVRLLVLGEQGEPLHLTRAHRLFSPAQKIALVVAAGGRCQFSGCWVPHPYLEAHHVAWFSRDHGETGIENGMMLCSYHHHLVHASDSPIEIRSHDGDHWIVPKGWVGPPDPRHRRQTGPLRDPDLIRLRPRPGPRFRAA